jgi:Tfp pilus assembly protein FimT
VSSLVEVVTVMVVVGTLTLAGVGTARAQGDRLRVSAAREEVAGVFRAARFAARAHGGARVHVDAAGRVTLWTPADSVLTRVDPGQHGVRLELAGQRFEAEFPFTASGVGRVASATLLLTRGGVERRLVISAQGRVRRER